jgi:hypothetical protein
VIPLPKKWFLVGFFGLLLIVVWSVAAAAQQAQTVTAEGVGAVTGGDRAMARDGAINDALRKAVEQAVGTLVSSETIVQNFQTLQDRIYTQTQGYIQSYKIISENPGANTHQVVIQATVAVSNLERDLQAIGILLGRVGKPRIITLIAEQNVGRNFYNYWWGEGRSVDFGVVENLLLDRFRERGFDIVDRTIQSPTIKVTPALRGPDLNDQGAVMLGKQAEAEIVIVGKALARSVGNVAGTAMKSVQANVSFRAIQIDNARVLSAGTEHGAAVHIDEITAGGEALKKAAVRISDKLIDDILKNFQARVGGMTTVQLTLVGLANADDVRRFKNSVLAQLRGIEGVVDRGYSENAARLDVEVKGNAQSLSEEISRKDFPDFVVKVIRRSWNTVDVQVTPR